MTFILQSKFVGRDEYDNRSHKSASVPKEEEDDLNGRVDIDLHSNSLKLPMQNYKASEYVSMQRGDPLSTRKDQPAPIRDKQPVKRRHQYSVFEDEGPLVTFSELPHPRELFGKRSRPLTKKEKITVSKVDCHKMQLQRKMAQHDIIRFEIPRKLAKDQDGVIQEYSTSNSIKDNSKDKGSCTLSEDSSFGSTDKYDRRKNIHVVNSPLFTYSSFSDNSLATSLLGSEKDDRESYSAFRFCRKKMYEE